MLRMVYASANISKSRVCGVGREQQVVGRDTIFARFRPNLPELRYFFTARADSAAKLLTFVESAPKNRIFLQKKELGGRGYSANSATRAGMVSMERRVVMNVTSVISEVSFSYFRQRMVP